MTRDVVSVSDTAKLADIAMLLETKRIKRVPVVRDGKLVVEVTKPKRRKRRYTLDELVAGITPENRHEEIDWGPPVGNEVW